MTNKKQPKPALWVGTAEAAEMVGMSMSTMFDWREQRIGPPWHKHPNGSIRYRVADIETYLSGTRFGGGDARECATSNA